MDTDDRRRRRWVLGGLAAYAGAVAVILLAPVSYGQIVNAIGDVLAGTFGLTGFGTGWIEAVANVLLFVPLGFLLTLLLRRHGWGVVLAIGLSVAAELAQAIIPSRQPSLRDVLTNAIGAAVGAALAWLIVVRTEARRRRVAQVIADA